MKINQPQEITVVENVPPRTLQTLSEDGLDDGMVRVGDRFYAFAINNDAVAYVDHENGELYVPFWVCTGRWVSNVCSGGNERYGFYEASTGFSREEREEIKNECGSFENRAVWRDFVANGMDSLSNDLISDVIECDGIDLSVKLSLVYYVDSNQPNNSHLYTLFMSSDSFQRTKIFHTLADIEPGITIDTYVKLAQDSELDAYYRLGAADRLAELGKREVAIETYVSLAQNPEVSDGHRLVAAYKLVELGKREEAIEAYVSLAQNPEVIDDYRLDAADRLVELDINKALKAYLIIARDSGVDADYRLIAADKLAELDPGLASETYVKLAQDSEIYDSYRLKAADRLVELGKSEEAVEAYVRLAQDPEVIDDYRLDAADRLVELDPESAYQMYSELVGNQETSYYVRSRAAEKLRVAAEAGNYEISSDLETLITEIEKLIPPTIFTPLSQWRRVF